MGFNKDLEGYHQIEHFDTTPLICCKLQNVDIFIIPVKILMFDFPFKTSNYF